MNAPASSNRRQFLRTSAAAALGGTLIARAADTAAPSAAIRTFGPAVNNDKLKIALIGCGGRGSGAVRNALQADKNIELVALADVFPEQAGRALASLQNEERLKAQVKVQPDHLFSGLDAYQKAIDCGVDVVLLATPPGFRPQHLKAAVAAGKHVFCEKPMATDAPGVRSVLESVRAAKAKKTALVAGFCWRYDSPRREFYKRVHDGVLGEVRAVHATYLTGPVKPMPSADKRPAGMGDVEWQLRNWYNFVWLCGDGLVEQACHSVDKIAWAFKNEHPVKCVATGGRNVPNNEGNIFDHIDVFYEFEGGARATMAQRQISNCHSDNSDYVLGTKGVGTSGWNDPVIRGENPWRYKGEKSDMYQIEHNELFASIRAGQPINDGDWMTTSTLMAIMGRMAAYTGQEISWEQALNSTDLLVPEKLTWDMALPIAPLAKPGITRYA